MNVRKKSSLSKRRAARKNYQKVAKTAKVGSGKRFEALEKSIAASGARNAAAVAASIGRKKYGNKKMASMSKSGRKR